MERLKELFDTLIDVRDSKGKRHCLSNIMIMSVYSILFGCFDFEEVADFCTANRKKSLYFTKKREELKHENLIQTVMEKHIVSDALMLATKVISDSHGQLQVKEIARQIHYSERQLNRLFPTKIGVSIKNYARLTCFRYVLKHIQTSPCFFASLSQQAGYFDQSHFDKDFKYINGVSP